MFCHVGLIAVLTSFCTQFRCGACAWPGQLLQGHGETKLINPSCLSKNHHVETRVVTKSQYHPRDNDVTPSHFNITESFIILDNIKRAMWAVTNTVLLYTLEIGPVPKLVHDLNTLITLKHETHFVLRNVYHVAENQQKFISAVQAATRALIIADIIYRDVTSVFNVATLPLRAVSCWFGLHELLTQHTNYLQAHVTITSCLIAAKLWQNHLKHSGPS